MIKEIKYPINAEKMPPSIENHSEVALLLEESRDYLLGQKWCEGIRKEWLFINMGEMLCIFLFEITNNQSPDDNLIWVMSGDFPPIYLDTAGVDDTEEVVDLYIKLVNDWIDHAENGGDLDECFPLLASWTDDEIQMLKVRTKLLKDSILPETPKISYKEAYLA